MASTAPGFSLKSSATLQKHTKDFINVWPLKEDPKYYKTFAAIAAE
jgi:hypothetical protein